MYEMLLDIAERPTPFSRYTTKTLWTRPHLAQQMLEYHLNQETDLASRRSGSIDQIVEWIDGQLGLSEKKLCDLGCGPGLYSEQFAARGAMVTGVDFSRHALEFARENDTHGVQYIEADYLSDELPVGFDLVTLIYHDLGALSPDQRTTLLARMRVMLNPGGHIIFDVSGVGAFSNRTESTVIEHRLMNGFWSPDDYVAIQRTFLYPEALVTLDRYVIVEPSDTWQIFNWTQHFTPEQVERELRAAGFQVDQMIGNLGGSSFDPTGDEIGIMASVL